MENAYRNAGFLTASLLALVFLGFYKTYFATFPEHFFSISWLVHLHAALATSWVLMLIAQPILIKNGRFRAHRRLGRFSYFLFPVMLLSALPMLFFVWLRGDSFLLFVGFSEMAMLLIFYACAIFYRKNTAVHARFMLATGLVLLDPTLGRMAFNLLHLPPEWGNHLPFLVMNSILLALIFFDWKSGRNFKPWVVVLGFFLLYQRASYWLASQQPDPPINSKSMDLKRIENAEIATRLDLFAAQPPEFVQQHGAESAKIDSFSVFICKEIPFLHFNVALDLGVENPFSEKTLDEILAYIRGKGIGKFYLQFTPLTQPQNASEWYTSRGMRHVSSWHRIARGNEPLGAPLPIPKEYSVEAVTPTMASEWAQFIDNVYGMPTSSWLLKLPGRPGWHHVVCRQAGKIVAARSMKINADGSAYFCIDAPVPGLMTQNFEADYLLARRLVEIGLADGVQLFTSDIEKPALAQDTPAYHFWSDLGFSVVYEKKNFVY